MIVLIYLFNPRDIIKIQVCRSGWDFTFEKLHLLSQLYVGQLKGSFVVKEKKQKATIIGVVRELSHQTLSIRTNEGYRLIEVADILEIRLWEEGVYD